MSFNDNRRPGGGERIADDIMENDFPVLKRLMNELAGNLDRHSQYLRKDREIVDEFLRENQRLFDNITLALKSEGKRKNTGKSSQLPRLEKTVADLERRLRLANATLNTVPTMRQYKGSTSTKGDQENPVEEEEKQGLIQDMDFEVHEENLKEREERIGNVNRNLKEVNKLYSEIAEMGKQQSEHVELIGDNIEKTAVKVMHSKRELVKAKEMFDETRERYCKTLCCLLVVFVIIVVMFFMSGK